ncbi:MAG: hypothetical protein EBV06_16555 [Planctomycetia bacterium]|nr:hypothetical protein [Planctomycetia bacterium]
MGRAIDGVKGREWEERLRRYADSQLTVGDCVLRVAKEAGRWTAWTAIEGKCGHRRRRVGIDWSPEPQVLPASSCGKKVRGNCGRDDAPSQ